MVVSIVLACFTERPLVVDHSPRAFERHPTDNLGQGATPLDIVDGGMPSLLLCDAGTLPVPCQMSLHCPVGDVTISEENGAIVAIDWGWVENQSRTPLLLEAGDQLQDYFDGIRAKFNLPLAPFGTEYQRKVWQALCDIPLGSTRTYADVARVVGGSPRSVGGANGRNPIPIIIPCHRVVATMGIGGYSGGEGLATKRFLLALEQAAMPDDLFASSVRA